MQDLAFADAAKPPQAVVLRLRMLNYSIGHELILLNKRNPIATLTTEEFLKLPEPEQIKHIYEAVKVCSRTWEQQDTPHRWLRLWRWSIRDKDIKTAVMDFLTYKFKGSSFPRINKLAKQPEGRTLGSPFLVRVLNAIGGDYNYPLGAAQWRYFAMLEVDGCIEIENEAECEIREEILAHEAKYEKEQAEKAAREGLRQP